MITRILRPDMEYLQSKHIVAERNSTSGQEPVTEEDKEDAMGLLCCEDTVEAAVKDDCAGNQKAESQQHHRDPAGPQETAGDDQLLHMEWEQQEEGRRKVVLVVATLAASVTYHYQAAVAFCEENKQQAYHRRRCMAFLFCNATAFTLSLVILMLLVNRKLFERRMQSNALSACVILDLAGLTDASAGASSRKVSTFVCVFITVFAVLGCTTVQVLVRTETCSLGHKGEAGTRLQDHHGMIGASATGSRRSAGEAIWRVASGAAHHMTGNQSLLLTGGGYLPVHHGSDGEGVVVHRVVDGGEEVPLRVRGSGSVRTERVALDDVWYVPGLDSNLVSTGQLARQGCDVTLGPGGCRITRAGALVGSARLTEAWHFQLDFLKVAGSE